MNLLPPFPTGAPAANLTPLLIAALNTDSIALLSKLLVGDILTGTVLGRGADGQTMLRTDRGVISLAGPIDASEGSKVTLEIRATGARLQVVLLAVEEAIPGAASTPAAAPAAPRTPLAVAQPTPVATDAARSAGAELIATVLHGPVPGSMPRPAAAAPALPNPMPLPPTAAAPATGAPAQPNPVPPPTAAAPAAGAPAQPNPMPLPLPTATAPAAPASLAMAAPAQPLPAGQRIALTVASVVPPGSPDPPVPPASGFLATVRSLTPTGQPIIETPLGTLAFERALAWPVGTRVLASFQPIPAAADEVGAAPQRGWTALLEAAALFDQPNRPDLTAALERVLPRIGPHLAVGLAAFLKPRQNPFDIGGPDLKTALAKIGRGDLAQRLQNEFAELSRALPNAEPGWRTIILPLVDENRLQQAMLAIHRDPPQGQAAERGEPGSVHFLLDVELSRLGQLQFDGLVRGKRLDLMLRTQRALDPAMRQEISEIFQTAQQATGYAGQLFFQAGAPFLKALAQQRDSGVVA